MNVLVLDNYDSFTWNLVQQIESLGARCRVFRSDSLSVADVRRHRPDRIVLSPGPFGPERAGICGEVVRALGGQLPILGVCLGMQAIATEAGATVAPSGRPVHGKASAVEHDGRGVFEDLPHPFDAARYHSLVVLPQSIPPGLEISAWNSEGTILGCRMKGRRVEGVLFHPESFLTAHGPQLMANFLRD
jgi:anthranilate synthase/aminodeoxychorismate synthase-like glutamine amidotransferase